MREQKRCVLQRDGVMGRGVRHVPGKAIDEPERGSKRPFDDCEGRGRQSTAVTILFPAGAKTPVSRPSFQSSSSESRHSQCLTHHLPNGYRRVHWAFLPCLIPR